MSQCFRVTFKGTIVIEIGVTERNVGVGMMANDVLMVPDQRGREPPPSVCASCIDPPVAGESKVGAIMENIDTPNPVCERGCP